MLDAKLLLIKSSLSWVVRATRDNGVTKGTLSYSKLASTTAKSTLVTTLKYLDLDVTQLSPRSENSPVLMVATMLFATFGVVLKTFILVFTEQHSGMFHKQLLCDECKLILQFNLVRDTPVVAISQTHMLKATLMQQVSNSGLIVMFKCRVGVVVHGHLSI